MGLNPSAAREYFATMRQRPGMYLRASDWSYSTAVAYLEGWLVATDPALSRAFSAWLGEPSIVWEATIALRRYPDLARPYHEFGTEANELLINDLFDALDGFLASREA
jgi:hypothetical protein